MNRRCSRLPVTVQPSVRKQTGNRAVQQEMTSDTAENPLTQPRMTVGPSHNQVDAVLSDDIQEKSFLAIAGIGITSLGRSIEERLSTRTATSSAILRKL